MRKVFLKNIEKKTDKFTREKQINLREKKHKKDYQIKLTNLQRKKLRYSLSLKIL